MRYLIILLCLATPAIAAPVVVQVSNAWSQPTTREDGRPLSPSDIAGYELTYIIDGRMQMVIPVAGDALTASVALALEPRTLPYSIARSVVAIDRAGVRSKPSNIAMATVAVAAPAANTIAGCMINNAKLKMELLACKK